ncbi:hypothetical protein DL95DRAFT_148356 [Leptodontidium sp. 2 PMI_412]|nr:hypothetical protein DL95DRAFT_148356 [Leptodontidium sp. 2 PMI_412]
MTRKMCARTGLWVVGSEGATGLSLPPTSTLDGRISPSRLAIFPIPISMLYVRESTASTAGYSLLDGSGSCYCEAESF